MCVARTARRRRKQARQGYKHLAKLGRPIYSKPSPGKMSRRLANLIEKQKRIQARKGVKS